MVDRALADHLQDSGALKTMWTYAATNGNLHGTKGERAVDADALRGDLNLVIIIIVVAGAGALRSVVARV